jgi:hypothetical protein
MTTIRVGLISLIEVPELRRRSVRVGVQFWNMGSKFEIRVPELKPEIKIRNVFLKGKTKALVFPFRKTLH